MRNLQYLVHEDWKVTRSLVSYDWVKHPLAIAGKHWKVTRSLVSYDQRNAGAMHLLLLKGHQIIGELRPPFKVAKFRTKLKGHQIIGELRQIVPINYSFGYQLKGHQIIGELRPESWVLWSLGCIERSPDHWWVTTSTKPKGLQFVS